MHKIDLDFVSIDELPASELLGAVGLYVLWAPTARKTPTYLGQGVVIERLSRHLDWISAKVEGLVAVLDTSNQKRDAAVAETALLWTADRLDRWPQQNGAPGSYRPIEKLLDRHDTIR